MQAVLERVWTLADVFSGVECARIVRAVDDAAARRGGWDKDRHGRYPTTDMPVGEVSDVEPLIRERLFTRVLRPLAPHYLPLPLLPEHLEFRDLFFVKYSAAVAGAQRDLAMHTDGSIFSFNVLLNPPTAFEGGGTVFEATGRVVQPRAHGSALGHSGQVRHGGAPITAGERYLLVGFVGCKSGDSYEAQGAPLAAAEAFIKFGHGAWDRSAPAEAVEM